MSSIKDFTVSLSELKFVGKDLSQPECVLAEKDGTLWTSNSNGMVSRINTDGSQTTLGDFDGEPIGLAMNGTGDFYVASGVGQNVVKLFRDGSHDVVLSEINGEPLGYVNFVYLDHQDRLWVTVSTRESHWWPAIANPRPDGSIILVDEEGSRVVADRLMFTNEVRMDANEDYLYVAETMAARVLRYPIRLDGNLGEQEVFWQGDPSKGMGPDGITFDAEGNLWVALILRNGLMIITPDGEGHIVFDDANDDVIEGYIAKAVAGNLIQEDMYPLAGETLQMTTSIAFGGPDLKTVYMGSLVMPHLLTFKSPVAGLPMRHWH